MRMLFIRISYFSTELRDGELKSFSRLGKLVWREDMKSFFQI